MTPRADFTCLSKKCRTDDGAPVYEDLPISSTRCPVCGSKRITRLWNKAPGMIRSGGRSMQHFIDDAGQVADATKTAGRDARLSHEKLTRELAAKGAGHGIRMVPTGRLNAELAGQGMGQLRTQPGRSEPSGMNAPLLAGTVAGRRPQYFSQYKPHGSAEDAKRG